MLIFGSSNTLIGVLGVFVFGGSLTVLLIIEVKMFWVGETWRSHSQRINE